MTSNTGAAGSARAWLNTARRALMSTPEPALEAHLLLEHVLGVSRAWLLAHPETELTAEKSTRLMQMLEQRRQGTPLPYLLGHWAFYGLDFIVTPDVLIPRPETELLVEQALAWIAQHAPARIVDVGTGSGCIAVTLKKLAPQAHVLAVDCSAAALRVARQNALQHARGAVCLWEGDLLQAACGPFDLVCANLPYIPQPALAGLPVARHEPLSALDGGADGLRWIRALLQDASRWISDRGRLLLEIQFDQGPAVTALAQACLPGAQVQVLLDLAGLPRVVDIQLPQQEGT